MWSPPQPFLMLNSRQHLLQIDRPGSLAAILNQTRILVRLVDEPVYCRRSVASLRSSGCGGDLAGLRVVRPHVVSRCSLLRGVESGCSWKANRARIAVGGDVELRLERLPAIFGLRR